MTEGRSDGFEELLEYLRDERGFDFTGYKRTSLGRRIDKRIQESGCTDPRDYLDHIQAHPEEVANLFDTILINVTGFFRDEDHWEHLREHVLPRLQDEASAGSVRIWSAGCSSGEEAYTLAILLAETLGLDRYREAVKIYATDADSSALVTARSGTYTAKDLESVPDDLRDKYFEQTDGHFAFRRDLRRSVVFGRHDLVQDAPISRIDLLVCRNVLMYFTTETQARILSRLHFALNPDGRLFLGRAEMLLTRTNLFEPVDLKHRVFRKSREVDAPPRPTPVPLDIGGQQGAHVRHRRIRDLAFAASPDPQVVIDVEGIVVTANAAARNSLGLRPDETGRRFSELEISYRPVDLGPHLDEARRERRALELTNVARVDSAGEVQHLDISIAPLADPDGSTLGLSIVFRDVTRYERLRAELQRANHDLETAYEELQSTNEELLTTNEELQSTIEELETTNEELQSANEELETMNEELQSSNVEQEEINEQLGQRTRALNRMNSLLNAILSTMGTGVIVLDANYEIIVWDETSEDTWGLHHDEVLGKDLRTLDFGLPVKELVPAIATCQGTGEPQSASVLARTRLGRDVTCDVQLQPLDGAELQGGVVVLLDTVRAS